MRKALRGISVVLIVCGVLLLADAGLTLVWQEPVTAIYALIVQGELTDDLHRLEHQRPTKPELAVLRVLQGDRHRMAFLARELKRRTHRGDAVGRIEIPKIGASFVVVNGTDAGSLRKGPGIYEATPFPGAPGTTAIAGHRTTYLAPFRRIDKLRERDQITIEMPYGRFTYAVEKTRIVPPSQISIIKRVSYDRLVLSACYPLYSAAKRIAVFARLVRAQARGAAL